jgi:predicted ATPase/DNA-binding CsgD family transcriptional regulator
MAARGARPGSSEHNLPIPLTTLVGRARELRAVSDALRRTRLVTVTGPGGVGKTRLALEVARSDAGRRVDGVWLVELGADPGTPDVAVETARALGVVTTGTDPLEVLRASLSGRELVIVLDNCEHVLEDAGELAARLLASCGELRILATSRESLGVNGETVWRLEPLGPEEAYRLFVERARARQPDFVPGDDADATIAELCARLDRLPFAIELAAARIVAMSPAEVLAALDARLGVLDGAGARAPAHHRTVRAAVEWSYELLSPAERRGLLPLAVFVGGFDAAAAVAVAPDLRLDLLARLVDKSLVSVTRSYRGTTRYRLLETVREYAHEQLVEAHDLDSARDRHLGHFAALAEVAREEWLSTGRQRFVNELDDDYENVRAALEWSVDADPRTGLRALAGTRDLFFRFGQSDGVRLATLLLERWPEHDRHRVEAQITAGQLANSMGDVVTARQVLAEALELSVELREPLLEAWIRFFQGLAEALQGDSEAAREHLELSRALHGELGSSVGEARATAVLALSSLAAGKLDTARELAEGALSMYVAGDDNWGQGHAHLLLGMVADASSLDPSIASEHYRTAVDRLHTSRDGTLLPVALIGRAALLARHDPARALEVAAAAASARARIGGGFPPVYRSLLDRVRADCEQALREDAERVWARGSRLAVDDAIALAFGSAKPRSVSLAGLTARELEVVALVSTGISNKAVAARLHLSVRTVESHVRHALAKLGLDNRTQLATWARDHVQ